MSVGILWLSTELKETLLVEVILEVSTKRCVFMQH